jgi:hypothetical protein
MHAARKGLGGFARLIAIVTAVIAGIIVIGILLRVFSANPTNDVNQTVTDVAEFLVGPFDGLFTIRDSQDGELALNWGIAALLWFVAGRVVAALLRRP